MARRPSYRTLPTLINSTRPILSDATLHYTQTNTHQLSEEARIVCLRFGADYTPECMEMDEMLYKIVDAVKDWVVIYVVDNKVLSPSFPSPFPLPSSLPILPSPNLANTPTPTASPRLQRHVRNLRSLHRHVLLAKQAYAG